MALPVSTSATAPSATQSDRQLPRLPRAGRLHRAAGCGPGRRPPRYRAPGRERQCSDLQLQRHAPHRERRRLLHRRDHRHNEYRTVCPGAPDSPHRLARQLPRLAALAGGWAAIDRTNGGNTMITWTERPSHQLWLHDETLRLLDFGRGALPTARGAAWLDDDGEPDPTVRSSPGSPGARRMSTRSGTCSGYRGAARSPIALSRRCAPRCTTTSTVAGLPRSHRTARPTRPRAPMHTRSWCWPLPLPWWHGSRARVSCSRTPSPCSTPTSGNPRPA